MRKGHFMLEFIRKRPPAEVKASAVGRVVAMAHGARSAAWTARDTGSLTRAGFMGNPIGFRAVRMISEAAAALPLICQDHVTRYEDHPVLARLKAPNPMQGASAFLEALYATLLLSGNAYIEAVMQDEAGGVPHELHILRSDRIHVQPGPDGWPQAFDYHVGGKSHRFSADVVCHIRGFHPQDDHYGLGPLHSAATAIDVHNAATLWSKALLDNAARPSGAIVYRGVDGAAASMSDAQVSRLQEELDSYHMGARNAGRPMLLDGGLDWKPMGFSPSDMEFHKTKEAASRDIALAFGVPPMLMGIPGDATYANYAEAHRAFYRLTVLPLAGKVLAALSRFLGAGHGADLELRVDLDQLPALAAERDAQWRRVSEATFLSASEKRVMLGLPALASEPS
jgi:HK97 family phage portal protein